jgi:putative ABC transport system permease protein
MIKFILNGILRDRSRSLFPMITVAMGSALTVLLYSYMMGALNDMVFVNANLSTGHVKIKSHYSLENTASSPIGTAMTNTNALMNQLNATYPQLEWVQRLSFGGILDFPDDNGETKFQVLVAGISGDFLSDDSKELERMKIRDGIKTGDIPKNNGEILISDQLAQNNGIKVGDKATLISSSIDGAMVFQTMTIAGTVEFGIALLDKGGAIVADVNDIKHAFWMDDADVEILGFFKEGHYGHEKATALKKDFNDNNPKIDDYGPGMILLEDQNDLGQMLQMMSSASYLVVTIFLATMFTVLWNAGLMNGLRRYGEMGLRLAIGETSGHVYVSMVVEALGIGFMGSIVGTIIGLFFSYILQEIGLDISNSLQNSTVFMNNIIRASITPTSFYIGFFPGLLAPVIGALLSGRAIYKRETATLFKELEN